MGNTISIPFEMPGGDKAVRQLEEIMNSFSGLERQTLKLAEADRTAGAAIEDLTAKFLTGQVSGNDYRAALAKVAEQGPMSAAAIIELSKANEKAVVTWASVATGIASVIAITERVALTFTGAITGVAELADEQDRLSRNSARMGVDFDVAAAAAGRFTDETSAMTAASTLFEAGTRLSQVQLDALMKTAGVYAQTMGVTVEQAVDTLTTGLMTGSARGLRPFGRDMVAASGEAHTMQDRLAALVTHAGHLTAATDNSRSAMERFKDSIGDSMRTAASSFITELNRINTAGDAAATRITGVQQSTDDFKNTLEGLGGVAARVFAIVASTAQIAFLTIKNGVMDAVEGFMALQSAPAMIIAGRSPIRDFMAASNERGRELQAAQARFRIAALGVDDRTSIPVSAAGGGPLTAAQIAAAADADKQNSDRNARLLAHHTAHPRAADMAFTAEQTGQLDFGAHAGDRAITAANDARATAEINARMATMTARNAAAREQEAAAVARDPVFAARNRARAYETRMEDQRLASLQSFTERWRDLHSQQADASLMTATSISGALTSVSDAMATHVQAMVTGQESVGQALRGMLADALLSIGKQAIVKGAYEIAEGIAALAGVVTAPLAPGHFAAGAAYMAVGSLASIAGAAVGSTSSASAGAGGGAAASVSPRSLDSGSGGSSGRTVINNYYAPSFGGREGTDSEVGQRMNRFTTAASDRLQRDRT